MERSRWFFWSEVWAVLLAVAIWGGSVSPAQAAERVPLRIAQFSWQVTSYWVPPHELLDWLDMRMDRALHVPLNGVLQAVAYIPEDQCDAALAEVWADYGKGRMRDIMKPLAEKLQADLVVYPVVEEYAQHTHWSMGRRLEPLLHSHVSLRVMGYDRRRDETFDKNASRTYHSDYSSTGEAAYLARECLEQVLAETKLRDRIYPLPEVSGETEEDSLPVKITQQIQDRSDEDESGRDEGKV